MSIAMACPYCYKELEFDEAEAGKETECPFCHRAIMVDGAEPPEEDRVDLRARRIAERVDPA